MPRVPAEREPVEQAVRVGQGDGPICACRPAGATEAVRVAGQPLAASVAGARAVPEAAAQNTRLQPGRDLPARHCQAAGHPAQSAVRRAYAERPPVGPVLLLDVTAPGTRRYKVSVNCYDFR